MKRIVVLLVMLTFISACSYEEKTSSNEYIYLDGDNIKLYEIYQIDEDIILYSSFSNPKYVDDKGNEMDLKQALKNKIVTIDDIISNMDYYTAANDGGSIYYKSKDGNVYLAKCNSLPGNGGIKDIFITDNENEIFNYCTK